MKKRIDLIIVALLVVWLLLANTVVLRCSNIDCFESKTKQEVIFQNDRVRYCIDGFSIVGGLLESVNINGWGFIETEHDNTNRNTTLYFIGNSSETYCVNVKKEATFPRSDVISAFLTLNHGNNREYGFNVNASTLNMKNGIYKLYISVTENEDDYGIADTGIWVKKDGRTLTRWEWQSQQVDALNAVNDSCTEWVDVIQVQDEFLCVNGWAFIEGFDCANQSVYVQLIDSTGKEKFYSTEAKNRADVADAFSNSAYVMSGFNARIPLEHFENENAEYKLKIFVENGEQIAESGQYLFSMEDGQIVRK